MHELVNGIVPIEAGEQERLIQVRDLRETTQRLYEAVGVPRADARLMVNLQVETDVRGVHSHGTRAVPGYLKRIQTGHTNPKPEIRVVREGPASATVDGDGCLGHLASYRAMQLAIAKANDLGIAATTVYKQPSLRRGGLLCDDGIGLGYDRFLCVEQQSRRGSLMAGLIGCWAITRYLMRFRRIGNIPLFWIWRRGGPLGVGWVRCVCTVKN